MLITKRGAPLLLVAMVLCQARCTEAASAAKPQAKQAKRPHPQAVKPLPPQLMSAKQVFAKFRGAVATVVADMKSRATGVVVNGELLTSYRAIEGSRSIVATFPGGTTARLEGISRINRALDLVGLPVWSGEVLDKIPPIALLNQTRAVDLPSVGDQVTVISSPQEADQTLSEGIVAGVRTVDGNTWFQLSIPLTSGTSGSPVFDRFGDLIGIITSAVKADPPVSFAVWIWDVATAPPSVPISLILNTPADYDDDPEMKALTMERKLDRLHNEPSLIGLRNFGLYAIVSEDADKQDFARRVADRLKQRGITIDPLHTGPRMADINVTVVRENTDDPKEKPGEFSGYIARVVVSQRVAVCTPVRTYLSADTYFVGKGGRGTRQQAYDAALVLVDQFCDAYHRANPQ
ncbi:MAG TPA: serine protease [Armatimonadota bacterium]